MKHGPKAPSRIPEFPVPSGHPIGLALEELDTFGNGHEVQGEGSKPRKREESHDSKEVRHRDAKRIHDGNCDYLEPGATSSTDDQHQGGDVQSAWQGRGLQATKDRGE